MITLAKGHNFYAFLAHVIQTEQQMALGPYMKKMGFHEFAIMEGGAIAVDRPQNESKIYLSTSRFIPFSGEVAAALVAPKYYRLYSPTYFPHAVISN